MDINFDPESELVVLQPIPRGALTVIMVDAETRQAIWAGNATTDIQENPGSEVQKKRLDYAVTRMFRQLPR